MATGVRGLHFIIGFFSVTAAAEFHKCIATRKLRGFVERLCSLECGGNRIGLRQVLSTTSIASGEEAAKRLACRVASRVDVDSIRGPTGDRKSVV